MEVAEEKEVIHVSGERHGAASRLAPGQPVYRILIAEDQRNNQLLLARMMSDLGLQVKAADNSKACLELFE